MDVLYARTMNLYKGMDQSLQQTARKQKSLKSRVNNNKEIIELSYRLSKMIV